MTVKTAPIRETALLEQAFTKSGAKTTGYLIHNYCVVNNQYLSKNELIQLASKTAMAHHFPNAIVKYGSGDGENLLAMSSQTGNKNVQVYLSSFRHAGTHGATVLVIREHDSTGSLQSLSPEMQKMYALLTRLHVSLA